LFSELDVIDTTAVDWAFWDDTYDFVQTGDPAYIDANLMDATFDALEMNLFLFHDAQGEIVYSKAYDLNAQSEVPLFPGVVERICNNPTMVPLTDPAEATSGIVLLPDGPMYVAAYPVLTSEHTGPAQGTLIIGRYLTSDLTEHLTEISDGNIIFQLFTDDTLPADVRDALRTTSDPIIRKPDPQVIVS
jgi:sensor domain CHASE-containing protein